MTEVLEGGCQCGAVRYRITGAPLTLYACHCTDCQKQASSAFGLSLWVRRDDFEVTRGEPKLWRRRAESGRMKACAFCADCGSRIYHASEGDPEVFSVKGGSLDDTRWLRPLGHIWTRSAQPWVSFEGVDGDKLLLALPELAVSTGSACTSSPAERAGQVL